MLRHVGAVIVFVLGLCGAAVAQNAPNAQNPSFNLINRSRSTINEAYATPAGMTTWGRDRLGDKSVPPGESFAVRLPADGNCLYDVRVVYANGATDEQRRLNTCTLDNVTFPPAGGTGSAGGTGGNRRQAADDPSFRLVNRGRTEVTELYATLTGVDDWGVDRLGDATVAAGRNKTIRLPNGQCIYDVRIVYANGEATEKRRLNLCTITDLRVP